MFNEDHSTKAHNVDNLGYSFPVGCNDMHDSRINCYSFYLQNCADICDDLMEILFEDN